MTTPNIWTPPQGSKPQKSWWENLSKDNKRGVVFAAAVAAVIIVIVALVSAGGGGGGGSSLSGQANAVMQLSDSAWSYGQPADPADVAVISNANAAFQNAIVITNDPTQRDDDYTAIGNGLQRTQEDASASNWTSYYADLGTARNAIQSARDDGSL